MRKKILLVILTVCLVFNVVPVFAEEGGGTLKIRNIITLYNEHDEVYVGEKIKVIAVISSADEGVGVKAVWMVNGEPVPGFSNGAFILQEKKQSEFNYVIPPDEEVSQMAVSFSLYDKEDRLISSAEKSLTVKKEIPVSIQSATKTQKAYFDQKVTVTVQLMNETGRNFDFESYWELNGEKVKGYESKHFKVGETAGSSCPITLSDFAGKKVKVTFVLDNGVNINSIDIEIEVLNYPPEVIYQRKVEEMQETIKSVEIECTLVRGSNVYKELSLKNKVAYKEKGTKGIYVNYSGTTAAKVRFPDGTTGWVPYRNISISRTNYTDSKGCSDELKEIFANENGYKSDTKYLIWISLKFQQVNAFQEENGNWKLVRSSMPCSTGKNTTPTISGVFKYFQYQKRWNFGKYYVAPVMRFNGGAALHSRTYKPDGSLLDPTLGKPASHGCVRLKQEDIDWLARNIPLKTTVVVY